MEETRMFVVEHMQSDHRRAEPARRRGAFLRRTCTCTSRLPTTSSLKDPHTPFKARVASCFPEYHDLMLGWL